MSNALALAGVTAVLKDLIDSGVIDHQLTDALGAGVTVSSLPPDAVPLEGPQAVPRLNLFLHQVTPNASWRNADLPARDSRGVRMANPPLALDLHYLLSAYGFDELQAEVLLGYALQLLHENPVLPRQRIRTALTPEPVDGAVLPSVYQALRSADLAEQVEQLKITPTTLGSEEMSRLWSALQARYRPTTSFQVSVVLIQPQQPARAALPVLRRGPDDRGPVVSPDLVPPLPTLESLLATDHATPSVLRLGDAATLRGHHLAGSSRQLVLRNERLGLVHTIALPDGSDEQRLSFAMPALPDALPAGLWRCELRVLRAGEARVRTSNALPLAIAPAVTSLPPLAMNRNAGNRLSLTLGVTPAVRAGQTALLRMGSQETRALPFAAPTTQLDFELADAPPAGTQALLRLQVDGIDSVVIDRRVSPPVFLDHRITLPA